MMWICFFSTFHIIWEITMTKSGKGNLLSFTLFTKHHITCRISKQHYFLFVCYLFVTKTNTQTLCSHTCMKMHAYMHTSNKCIGYLRPDCTRTVCSLMVTAPDMHTHRHTDLCKQTHVECVITCDSVTVNSVYWLKSSSVWFHTGADWHHFHLHWPTWFILMGLMGFL